MSITRIQNNQITDGTIQANAKVMSGSITGNLFATSVTLNSNITVLGNLTVSNNYTQLNSVNTYIGDPLVVFNNNYPGGTPSYDIGLLVDRGLYNTPPYGSVNAAWIWREADTAFEGLMTTETGTTAGSINNSGFANMKIGNVTAVSQTITSNLSVSGGTTLSSNISVAGSTALASTLTVTGASQFNSTVGVTGVTTLTNSTQGSSGAGALVVQNGGAYIAGNLYVGGNINLNTSNVNVISGNSAQFFGNAAGFGALYAGINSGYVYQAQTVLQNSTNFNGYAQVNHQNINGGANASTDYVATADAGTAGAGYIDMGINSSGFVGGPGNELNYALDGYLYVTGTTNSNGNLLIGTSSATDVVISTSGFGSVNQQARFKNNVGLIIYQTTSSTNTTSGALQVAGGAGIAGATYIGGILNTAGATTLQSTLTVTGVSTLNSNVVAASSTASTSTTTGALVVTGGVGIGGALNVGSTASIAGVTSVTNSTASTSSTTGALVVTGGVGIGGAVTTASTITASGNIVAASGTASSSTTTGALVVAGGAGISGALNVGSTLNVAGNAKISGNLEVDGTLTYINTTTELVSGVEIVAGNLIANSNTTSSSVSTGALVVIGGAGISGALNVGGTITAPAATIGSVNGTVIGNTSPAAGNFTTLEGNNFSSGNVQITGGSLTGVTGNFTTLEGNNFSTGNAQITGGTLTGVTGNFTTLEGNNFSSGNVQISGGIISGISALNAVTGTTSNFASGNAQITGGTLSGMTAGNFTTLQGTNFSSANAIVSTGYTTNFSTANAVITGGSVNSTPIGATTASTGAFTTLSTSGVTTHNGNLVAASTTNTTSTTTGALVVVGGVGISANLFVGGGSTLGSARTAYNDTVIQGKNDATLMWARSGTVYDQVVFGNSATTSTLVQGAKVIFNTTDSMIIPSGVTGQRPSSVGYSDAAGMIRFNTTTANLEYYNGTGWMNAGTTFTIIADDQITANGSTSYTLGGPITTSGSLVSINGVIQIPTLAYTVSGTTITFSEAVESGDIIDVRRLTTTQSVTAITSTNGYMGFSADNNGAYVSAGSAAPAVVSYWDTSGGEVTTLPNTVITSSGVNTAIDTFSATAYRTARYIVQATNGSNYESKEVMLIQNGASAIINVFGNVNTGSSLGTLTAGYATGVVTLYYNASNNNTNVRIKKEYVPI